MASRPRRSAGATAAPPSAPPRSADAAPPAPAPEPPPVPELPPAPGSTSRPGSLRERVERHPIGLFVGIILAAVTTTLSVVVPVLQITGDNRVSVVEIQMEQDRAQHAAAVAALQAQIDDLRRQSEQELAAERTRAQARVDELDRSLSSIRRSLGSDTEYYDVGSLVVDPTDVASLPTTSAYFPDDRFYALDVSQATGWTYEVTSELKLTAEQLGVTEEFLAAQAPPATIEAMRRFPIHAWRYGPDREITYADPLTGTTYELHPRTQAWVQRITDDQYLAMLEGSLPSPQPSGSTLAASIRSGFARDPAGWALQDQLLSEIVGVGSLRPRIDSLQKRDDLAYARVETVLPTVDVEGRQLAEYYLGREWLIVRTDRDLYLVKLFVADDDHRSPDYGALSAWLDHLRIVGS
jgi:hypothetical protein